VLTIGAIVQPAADLNLWHVVTMTLAWVAVLASALASRDGAFAPIAHDDRSRVAPIARPAEVAPAPVAAHQLSSGSAEVIDFARELHATLENDRLRLLIGRRLPGLLGVRDVWVVARFGNRQQVIVPSLGGSDAIAMVGDEPRHWATYPMKADGQTVGVLGAALPARGFSEQDHRQFKLVTSLIAQSLATATAFEAMREASLVDALTGCATRGEGARRLEAELRRAQRSGTSVAVLMLDLDHFKSINDRFGHKTGDAALTAVGETLLTTLRASDVRSRWGGEEFLLVLPDSSMERAQRAADNLRQRIANTPVSAGDHLVNVTASIGVTLSERGETDVQQLLARADNGLYEAKRLGRNRISLVLSASSRQSGGRAPRPGSSETGSAQAGPAARQDQPEEEWDGVDRRDRRRGDRRSQPSPGRRATDAALAGLSNAR
jgi:diguanylate cyclase (GGDEF)-like protein